jgi:indolepyruvate ferredoxin oxidoreductase beta subunit
MNYELVICGVGGQGVLSIAWVVDQAAVEAGFHIKQPEVHGMAQRGGAVSAFVRIADAPIASDLVADGTAGMVLSVEPMESLRYAKMLRPDGWIVTDVTPLKNVAAYPDTGRLFEVLFSAPRLIAVDAGALARRAGMLKANNMVMLGAAASLLPVPADLVEKHLRALFAAKGERIVNANVQAFRMGDAAGRFAVALIGGGIPAGLVARVVPRLAFEARPVAEHVTAQWLKTMRAPGAAAAAARLFESGETIAPDNGLAALAALAA